MIRPPSVPRVPARRRDARLLPDPAAALLVSLVASASLLVAVAPAPAQRTLGGAGASFWSNPTFRKEMLGSFGVKADVEPLLEPDEQAVYDEVVPMIGSEPEKARARLEELLGLELSDQAEALFAFTLGNIHYNGGNDVEAARRFLQAVDKFPSFLRAHKNLAIVFVKAGRHDRAIHHFGEAIRLGAFDGTVFGLLGTSFIMVERPIEAETAFRNAIMLAPTVREWKLGLVRALFGQERFKEAASLLDGMIAAAPEETSLWTLQASAHIGSKDFLAAAANYEILDAFGKATVEELNTLGDIYVNEGLLRAAVSAYLRAYDKNPQGIDGPIRAAEVLVSRDGVDLARELLGRVRANAGDQVSPNDWLRMLRLDARIAFAEGEEDRAAEILEQVVELDPLDGSSLIDLGQYYGRTGEPEKAINKFEMAENLEASAANAFVRHGQLLVRLGRYDEAVPLLKRAQEIEPRDSVARFLEDLEEYVKRRRR